MSTSLFSIRRSFRGIVFIGMIIVGVIPMLLLGLYSTRVLNHSAEKSIENEINLSSTLIQNRIASMISDTEAKIEHIAMHLDQCLSDEDESLMDIAQLLRQIDSWESYLIIDRRGIVKDVFLPDTHTFTQTDIIGSDFSGLPYYKSGSQINRIRWSDAYDSPLQHKTAIAVTRRLKTGDTLVVTFTLRNLFQLIDLNILSNDITAVVLDHNNVIIYHPEQTPINFSKILPDQIKNHKNPKDAHFHYQFQGKSYVGIIHPILNTPWKLLLSTNIEFINSQKREVAVFFIISILAGLTIALSLAFWFYKIVQRHLENLTSRIREIKDHRFDDKQRLSEPSRFEEFLVLETAFSSMSKVLETRERELEKQKLHFENLFNAGNDAIFLLDSKFLHILDVNTKAMEVTGLQKSTLDARRFPELIFDKDQKLLAKHQLKIDEDGHAIHDIRLRTTGGKEDYYELNSIRYHSVNRDYILCIARDIRSRKKTERLLKKAKRRAELANRSKDEFLAMISHELRTPLNSIIGFASLLEADVQDDEQRELISQIANSGHHLVRLFDDILDYSKLASGTIKIIDEETSLREVLEEVNQSASLLIDNMGKQIQLLTNIESSCPDKVKLDRLRVGQILMNMVVNAIKFTETGEVEINLKDVPPSNGTGPLLQFNIRDTGIGMNSLELEKIWEPFHQNDASYKRNHNGVGLGLAICRKLVEAMNGSITCQSKRGKGTTFTIQLPLVPCE